MPALWKSIIRIMSTDIPEYHADFLGDRDPSVFERIGIFVPHSSLELAECPECHELCEIRVLQDSHGKDAMFCICPSCGPSRFAPSVLRRWRVYWEPLVERVVTAMDVKGTPEPLVPDFIWKLGRKVRKEVLFVRRCQEEHLKMLLPVLLRYSKSLLMTLSSGTAERLRAILANRIFSLEETTRFDPGSELVIDMDEIQSLLGPEEGESAKPTPRRATRLINIEKLTAEMREHYRRSKDHYYAAGNILRRPSQAELARMAGLRQDDVSRCLHDKDAIILQHLWEHSENLKAVLDD